MKIRTAIFGVYVTASAVGFAVLMAFVLQDVRLRYVESMRRTMGDTASFLAAFAAEGQPDEGAWVRRLAVLPSKDNLFRIFACDRDGLVLFDSAKGRDVNQRYTWLMVGGGHAASENYTLANVAMVDGELRVRAPVRIDGELTGWVGVGRQLATVDEGVSQARWRLGWRAGALAAVMAAAGWWLASRLTHSLERLTAYAVAAREGRVTRPPASQAAEIAALGRAFEEMRITLEDKAHVERYTQALAHEFKAPLSAIRGAAELLGEDMPREERAKFIGNLRAESNRMQLIVDRLLELAALEARRDGTAETAVDLCDVVREVCDGALLGARTRGVTLDCSAVSAAMVRGEKFLLGQAIANLVQNALEFTAPGGAVTVTVGERDGAVCATVEDNGPGVPAYALEKIFDRFYSLPRPDTGRKSSGLGLSIVREIARLHGGEITLENRREGGARASLRLPSAPA